MHARIHELFIDVFSLAHLQTHIYYEPLRTQGWLWHWISHEGWYAFKQADTICFKIVFIHSNDDRVETYFSVCVFHELWFLIQIFFFQFKILCCFGKFRIATFFSKHKDYIALIRCLMLVQMFSPVRRPHNCWVTFVAKKAAQWVYFESTQ